MFVNKLV